MAGETGTISWLFKLVDGVSGPAKAITASVNTVTASTVKADVAVAASGNLWKATMAMMAGTVEVTAGAIAGAFSGIGAAFRTLTSLPALATGFFAAWGGKLIIDSQEWRQSTLDSLEVMLGGQKAAVAVMGEIQRLSQTTDMPMTVVGQAMEAFLRTGKVNVGEIRTIMRALADVMPSVGFKPEAFTAAADAVAQMMTGPVLRPRGLVQQAGVPYAAWLETLAKMRGETIMQTKRMIALMRVSGKEGAEALILAIREVYDRGNPLGYAFDKAKGTLPEIIARFKADFANLFTTMDLTVALKPFANLINAIDKVMTDPAMLATIKGIVGQILEALFGPAAAAASPQSIMAFLKQLPGYAREAHDAIAGFTQGVRDAAGVMRMAAAPFMALSGIIDKMFPSGKKQSPAEQFGQVAGFALTLALAMKLLGPMLKPLAAGLLDLTAVLFRFGLALYFGTGPIGLVLLGLTLLGLGIAVFHRQIGDAFNDMIVIVDRWADRWIARMPGVLLAFQNSLANWRNWILKWAYQLGIDFVDFIVRGLTLGLVGNFSTTLANIGRILRGEKPLPPGRVFTGFQTGLPPAGALPPAAGAGIRLTVPTLSLPGAPSAPAAGTPGSRVPANLSMTFNIDGAQTPAETAAAVRDSVTSQLGQWFDLFNQETGGVLPPVPTGRVPLPAR